MTWLFRALLGVNGRLDIRQALQEGRLPCQEENRVCYEGIRRPGWIARAIWYQKGTEHIFRGIFF